MSGDRLAHLSLRFDAIYCVVLGLVVAGTAPLAARGVALSAPVLVGVGGAVFTWGAYVWWASFRTRIRASTRFVMSANIAATLGLAATGLVAETTALTLAAFVLAVDVTAFAVSQGVALRLLKRAATV